MPDRPMDSDSAMRLTLANLRATDPPPEVVEVMDRIEAELGAAHA